VPASPAAASQAALAGPTGKVPEAGCSWVGAAVVSQHRRGVPGKDPFRSMPGEQRPRATL
jgi:hypothetical protein